MTAISSSSEHDDRIGAGVLPACVQTAFSMQRAGAGMSVGNGVSSSVVLIQLRRVPARHDACCVHVTSSPSRLRTRTNTSSSVAAVSTFGRSDMTNGPHLWGGGKDGSPRPLQREQHLRHNTVLKSAQARVRAHPRKTTQISLSPSYIKKIRIHAARPAGRYKKQRHSTILHTVCEKGGARRRCAPEAPEASTGHGARDAPSVTEAVLRPEREGRGGFELASRFGAIGANSASAGVDERAGRVHAQVGVVEVPAHVGVLLVVELGALPLRRAEAVRAGTPHPGARLRAEGAVLVVAARPGRSRRDRR